MIARLCAFILLYAWVGGVASEEVNLSLKRGHGVTFSNLEHYAYNDVNYAVAYGVHRLANAGSVYSFLSNNDGSIVYSLSVPPTLFAASTATRQSLGSWPLSRYDGDTYLPQEMIDRATQEYALSPDDDLLGKVPEIGVADITLGCLPQAPLRSGDFSGNGTQDIVVLFANDLLVFSPALKKVIFSVRLRIDDWLTKEETQQHWDVMRFNGIPQDDDGQYASRMSVEVVSGGVYSQPVAGYRGYGKMFWGDLDGDNEQDLIVWHKFYRSRLVKDPVKGFEPLYDTYQSYRFQSGEYLPSALTSDQIKSWLTTHNLTWQKGFPTYSECPGEEGKLIPELHDPLLNDPDVLK